MKFKKLVKAVTESELQAESMVENIKDILGHIYMKAEENNDTETMDLLDEAADEIDKLQNKFTKLFKQDVYNERQRNTLLNGISRR